MRIILVIIWRLASCVRDFAEAVMGWAYKKRVAECLAHINDRKMKDL